MLIYPKPSLLGFCSEFSQKSKGLNQTFYFRIFRVLHNLQLSRFFVVVSFSTARLFYHSCLSLSTTFFILFFVAHQQLNHLIMYHCFCQQLFLFFSNSFLFEPLLSQWNYNITSPSAIVKRICSIFLHNFFPLYTLPVFPGFSLFFRS